MKLLKSLAAGLGLAPVAAFAGPPVVITWGPVTNVPVMGDALLLVLALFVVVVAWRMKHLLPGMTSSIVASAALGVAVVAGVGVADKASAVRYLMNMPVVVESSSGEQGIGIGVTCVDNESGIPIQLSANAEPGVLILAPEGVFCNLMEANGGGNAGFNGGGNNGGGGSAAKACIANAGAVLADQESCAIEVQSEER